MVTAKADVLPQLETFEGVYWCRGHITPERFNEALWDYDGQRCKPDAIQLDYMRWIPIPYDIVNPVKLSGMAFEPEPPGCWLFGYRKGRGAIPVTWIESEDAIWQQAHGGEGEVT